MAKTARLVPLKHDTTLDQAEELRRVHNANDYRQSVLSEDEFMHIRIPPRRYIVRDLIVEKTITIVNGYRGGGKSWCVTAIGNEVSWGGQIGPWTVETPTNVLIIDGEMPMSLLQERLDKLNMGRNIKHKPAKLYIYPESYAYRIGLKRASILDTVWRERMHEEIDRLQIGLLILDNLSSLAPGVDENEKMSFDAVNRWLLELRFNGITIIMTHHTGKSGEQRGTSAHEDHVDTALVLTKPKGYAPEDGCKFLCVPTKDRMHMIKENVMLQLVDDADGRSWFESVKIGRKVDAVKLNPDMSLREAKEKGISSRTYYRAKKTHEK